MMDLTLTLMALIAGGFTVELFSRSSTNEPGALVWERDRIEEFQCGNPS